MNLSSHFQIVDTNSDPVFDDSRTVDLTSCVGYDTEDLISIAISDLTGNPVQTADQRICQHLAGYANHMSGQILADTTQQFGPGQYFIGPVRHAFSIDDIGFNQYTHMATYRVVPLTEYQITGIPTAKFEPLSDGIPRVYPGEISDDYPIPYREDSGRMGR